MPDKPSREGDQPSGGGGFGGAFGPLEDLVGRLVAGLEQGLGHDERGSSPSGSGSAGSSRTGAPRRRAATPRLDRYGRDLTAAARDGALDPVVGRADEIDAVLEVLARRTKNNPVLLGDPGVGKTAIVEGIAARIVAGEVPDALRDVRVVALDLAGMVAGTKYRGEFEQRLTAVIDEVVAARRSVVVFVDELHAVVGAGAAEGGAMDAGTILKPALARGELQMIGATTLREYRRHIERDPALERRFEPVRVPEPTVEQTVAILRGLRERYEHHHGVRIPDAALEAAAALADRYVRDRFLPDKAIDLVDRAAARVRLRAPVPGRNAADDLEGRFEQLTRARDVAVDAEDYERAESLTRELDAVAAQLATAREAAREPVMPELTRDDVTAAVARATGIPVARVDAVGVADRERLLGLEEVPGAARRRAGRGGGGGRGRRAGRPGGPGGAGAPGGVAAVRRAARGGEDGAGAGSGGRTAPQRAGAVRHGRVRRPVEPDAAARCAARARGARRAGAADRGVAPRPVRGAALRRGGEGAPGGDGGVAGAAGRGAADRRPRPQRRRHARGGDAHQQPGCGADPGRAGRRRRGGARARAGVGAGGAAPGAGEPGRRGGAVRAAVGAGAGGDHRDGARGDPAAAGGPGRRAPGVGRGGDVAGRARRGRAQAGSPAAAAHGGPRGGPDAVADAAGGRGRRRGRGPGGRRRRRPLRGPG